MVADYGSGEHQSTIKLPEADSSLHRSLLAKQGLERPLIPHDVSAYRWRNHLAHACSLGPAGDPLPSTPLRAPYFLTESSRDRSARFKQGASFCRESHRVRLLQP
jgi:hypothetical protein